MFPGGKESRPARPPTHKATAGLTVGPPEQRSAKEEMAGQSSGEYPALSRAA